MVVLVAEYVEWIEKTPRKRKHRGVLSIYGYHV